MKSLFSRGTCAVLLACVLLTVRAEAQTSMEIFAGGSPFVGAPANTVPVHSRVMAIAPNGFLYLADDSSRLLRFDPATSTITSVPNLPGLLEYRFDSAKALDYGPGVLNLIASVSEQWQLDLVDGGRWYIGPMDTPDAAKFTPDGTLYYSRWNSNAIFKRTLEGVVSIVAGSTSPGFSGDGTTSALFNQPRGIAIDAAGNIYIADTGNHRIRRRAAATGIITTIAGTGANSYNGDNLLALQTNLSSPATLAIDAAGNLYIMEAEGTRIRKLTASTGRITNIAGNGFVGGDPGNGGLAVNATINSASDIEIASNGTLYIAEPDSVNIRKVDPSGVISQIIGNGTTSFCGEGVPARQACLSGPSGIAIDDAGNVFFSDQYNRRIRKISAATGLITTIAGGNGYSSNDDVGPATAASFTNGTIGLVLDSARNLYVAEPTRIRRIDAASGIITTVAGSTSWGFAGDGGPAGAAMFNGISYLALDHSGNLYLSDSYNHRVRRIDASTGIVTTVAGTGVSNGPLGDGGPATAASLGSPNGLAFDPSGNLLIGTRHRIRKVNIATGVITTIAGNGTYGYSGNGGPATAAAIGGQAAFTVDAGGNIFLVSEVFPELRRIDASTGIIDPTPAPIWGLYTPEGRSFESAEAMVLGNDNRLYVTDGSGVVLRVSGIPTPASDLTPPVIEPVITGTLGTNDWYRSNVQVTWSVTDPESAVTTTFGCEQSGLHWDTEGMSFQCRATSSGGTAYRYIVVKRDTVAPQITFGTPTPAPNAAGWNSTDVSVPFNANDALSGVYSTSSASPVTITGSGSNRTASVLVTDSAGNTATFTTPAVNIDRSPPEVIGHVSGTLGTNDWYTSNVQVSWTVTAGASPVSSSAGCGTSDVTTDTAGVTFTCAATSAGGTNTQSVTIKRDATAPQLEFGAPSPAPDASGWFGGDVTFPFTATDAMSGVSSPGSSGSVVVTGTGTGLTSQVTVTDGAGNSALFTTPAVNITSTPPVITAQISGTLGSNGWYQSNVQVSWTIDSGVTPASSSTGCGASDATADTAGTTFTCTATSIGGTSTQSVTIKRDASAPMLTFGTRTPVPNSRGWHRANVSFPFTTSDVMSGVASTSTPSPAVITGSGTGLTAQVVVTDAAGNSATFTTSPVVKIDRTLAVITPNIAGTLGNNGWYRSNVQLTWTVDKIQDSIDWTSGCGTYNVTADTSGVSYSCGVQSAPGYTSKTVSIKRDATAPVITITSPANGAIYSVGESVTSSFGCTDARMQSCTGSVANGTPLDTTTAGTGTFTVNAVDLAGNTSTLVRTYTIQ